MKVKKIAKRYQQQQGQFSSTRGKLMRKYLMNKIFMAFNFCSSSFFISYRSSVLLGVEVCCYKDEEKTVEKGKWEII